MSQNRIDFVCGRKGCGKTTLLLHAARKLYNSGKRVIVLAPMGGITLPGAPVVYKAEDLISESVAGRSIVCLPGTDARLPKAVFAYCYASGNCTLIVDEVAIEGYGDRHSPDENFVNMVYYGRHRQCSLIAATHRPADVFRNLTGQSDNIYIFGTEENRDIEYLTQRITRETAEQVRTLPKYSFLRYEAGGVVTTGNVTPTGVNPENAIGGEV